MCDFRLLPLFTVFLGFAEEEIRDFGVKVALSMLKFYKSKLTKLDSYLPCCLRYILSCLFDFRDFAFV